MCLFATHYFELTAMADLHQNVANVHLDAVEHEGRIIFMHRIKTGATDRSYGLQVAQLAGLPEAALGYARDRLAALEGDTPPPSPTSKPVTSTSETTIPELGAEHDSGSTPVANGVRPAAVAASQPPQLDLFAQNDALVDYLKDLDVDSISARQALDHLYKMADIITVE